MSRMTNAIPLALTPVFFVMALGYGAGRLRIVDNHQVDGLNALVMDFALPASLFMATASASRDQLFAQVPLFAIFGGVMLVLYSGWYFSRPAWSKVSRADASLQGLTIAFPNLAGVGLPIAHAVLGSSGTIPIAVGLAAGSILVSPLTLILLELGGGAKGGGAEAPRPRMLQALRRALSKPVVVAPALGILVSLSGLKLGEIVEACLMLIGQATASGHCS
jgi:malonate transporter